MAKLSDILGQPPKMEWVVRGLIPEGHTILVAGEPGAGKSWFVEALALSVASGEPFLRVFPVLKSSVILIDEDTPEIDFNNHLRKIGIGLGIYDEDIDMNFYPRNKKDYRLDTDTSINQLQDLIKNLPPPVLIIFDCLGKVIGEFDDRQEGDVEDLFKQLNKIKAADTTIVLVHHFGKKEGDVRKDFTKKVLGSIKVIANSDTAFGIENVTRVGGETHFLLTSIERRRKLYISETFGIELTDKDDGVTLTATDQISRAPTEDANIIYKYIYKNRGTNAEFTVNSILTESKKLFSEIQVRKALKELEKEEAIIRESKAHNLGVFKINPASDPDNRFSFTTDYIEALTEGL